LDGKRLREQSFKLLFRIFVSIRDGIVMTGAYLDAIVGGRMRIQERYVQASIRFLEGPEALKHPV
jgi:hypothetical protein